MFQAVGARSAPFQRRTHALVPRSRCRASPLTQQRSSNAITLDVLGRSRMDHDIRRGSLLRWATARRVRSPHTDQAVAVAAGGRHVLVSDAELFRHLSRWLERLRLQSSSRSDTGAVGRALTTAARASRYTPCLASMHGKR